MKRTDRITLKLSQNNEDDEVVAYLTLPGHPSHSLERVAANTIRLRDLIADYKGPDLFFDFDENKVLIGVEILD
jgi:hypothetical protein